MVFVSFALSDSASAGISSFGLVQVNNSSPNSLLDFVKASAMVKLCFSCSNLRLKSNSKLFSWVLYFLVLFFTFQASRCSSKANRHFCSKAGKNQFTAALERSQIKS